MNDKQKIDWVEVPGAEMVSFARHFRDSMRVIAADIQSLCVKTPSPNATPAPRRVYTGAGYTLHPTQFLVLRAVGRNAGASVERIAGAINRAACNVHAPVDRLIDMGLIERRSPADYGRTARHRNESALALTKRGWAFLRDQHYDDLHEPNSRGR